MTNPTPLQNLFLRQSTLDAWEDYQRSLHKVHVIQWDYVILTASNEDQAKAYRLQLEDRLKNGLLPASTHYAVLPDPMGKRVGSGGATLNVLRYIREHSNCHDCFDGKRILVIHSGGDSKRVPQYSACGKLFSPVPRQLPDGRRSTLFDEFVITMSGVPARIKDGMLVLSGDVLLLFNPLQIDFQFSGAAAISMKEQVEIGKNHGVFLSDEAGNVGRFLHKMSVTELSAAGAVNEQGNVDLDTGAIVMDSSILRALFSLISTDGQIEDTKFNSFVNDTVRLSFYGDFLYPLASHSSLQQYYLENPEGDYSEELTTCRTALWGILHPFSMKLISLSPAKFIHFGTTGELLSLLTEEVENYHFLDWRKLIVTNTVEEKFYACSNAFVEDSVDISNSCYIEDSYLYGNTSIGDHCVISNVILKDVVIPAGITLHGIKLKDGKYIVRIYGTKDNPKGTLESSSTYLGVPLKEWMERCHMEPSQIWGKEVHSLWNARLFPICDTMEEAVQYALMIYNLVKGKSRDCTQWLLCERMSLCSSFNSADVTEILRWQQQLDLLIRQSQFINAIRRKATIEEAAGCFGKLGISDATKQYLCQVAEESDFSTRIRIYYYLAKLTEGILSEELENRCFAAIREGLCNEVASDLQFAPSFHLQKEEVKIELPVRVNFGGGWSDTPPYCNENGGTVINIAVSVRNKLPIKVHIRRLAEPHIILASTDSGASATFTDIRRLQDCQNPFDPFALHKAALIACGFIPMAGEMADFDEFIAKLGGGMYLSTHVDDIPRGSGLGTSSILAGACVKGLYEMIGQPLSDAELYSRVIAMEQIMSTGGGWQDQVGGVTKGLKFITSKPGIEQVLQVERLELSEETKRELQERFTLIYTGQRRLARNLLREVVGRYLGAEKNTLEVLYEIQRYATLMRFELLKGNVDGFAKLLDEHWELSKRLDHGCTNTCIDQIFLACEEFLDAKMICGAGGGGFLQVILKKDITKEMLHKKLKEVFQDSGVDVWECELLF